MVTIRLALLLLLFSQLILYVSLLKFSEEDVIKDVSKWWKIYKDYYRLSHPQHRDKQKMHIFHENVKYIIQQNKKKLGYTLGINQFTHMSEEEIRAYSCFNKLPNNIKRIKPTYLNNDTIIDKDWRESGIVPQVRDQGACGSCYAFSTIEAHESHLKIKTGKTVVLSPQDVIDCSRSYHNLGCSGGDTVRVFNYLKDVGVNTEARYPYVAYTQNCKHSNITRVYKIAGYTCTPKYDENSLARVISTIGPVSVAIDANHKDFLFYSSGIYYNPECNSNSLDHAVLAVGIGSKPLPYYVVMNSWGTLWGTRGFIKMARNRNNNCGIATYACYPKVVPPKVVLQNVISGE